MNVAVANNMERIGGGGAMSDRRENWNRREFVGRSTLAGMAGLLGLRPEPVAAEPPPETTKLALDKVTADKTTSPLYSYLVPGGILGSSGRLRLTVQGTVSGTNTTSSDTDDTTALTLNLQYGATVVATLTIQLAFSFYQGGSPPYYTLGLDGPESFILTGLLSGDGATNAQLGTLGWQGSMAKFGRIAGTAFSPVGPVVGQPYGGTNVVAAEDSTAAKTLQLAFSGGGAQWGRVMVTLQSAMLERIA
jgi:hypothetical protein